MKKFFQSTALALALGFFLAPPEPPFVYKSAEAAESSIPDWIAASCCGPKEAHRLRASQVSRSDDSEYYIVEGFSHHIPYKLAQPSQDSNYWIFYSDLPPTSYAPATQSRAYCFFIPMAF